MRQLAYRAFLYTATGSGFTCGETNSVYLHQDCSLCTQHHQKHEQHTWVFQYLITWVLVTWKMVHNSVHFDSLKTAFLGKIWFSFGIKSSQPIRLQYSLIIIICGRNQSIPSIFCMEIIIKVRKALLKSKFKILRLSRFLEKVIDILFCLQGDDQ